MKKNEQSLRKMWETNSLDIYVKENQKEESERGANEIFKEIMTENFLNLQKNFTHPGNSTL